MHPVAANRSTGVARSERRSNSRPRSRRGARTRPDGIPFALAKSSTNRATAGMSPGLATMTVLVSTTRTAASPARSLTHGTAGLHRPPDRERQRRDQDCRAGSRPGGPGAGPAGRARPVRLRPVRPVRRRYHPPPAGAAGTPGGRRRSPARRAGPGASVRSRTRSGAAGSARLAWTYRRRPPVRPTGCRRSGRPRTCARRGRAEGEPGQPQGLRGVPQRVVGPADAHPGGVLAQRPQGRGLRGARGEGHHAGGLAESGAVGDHAGEQGLLEHRPLVYGPPPAPPRSTSSGTRRAGCRRATT